ncbi:hypothetical protein PVK06_043954 [Gossypium arboreum]|uniref:Enolpyruvate transferase domain-containing protein n=1 Tax=Gossypium arboreum TaxID=29729 RepID=A0ABR0MRV1_GOSAR|nr:hypothetical protein PVK06_043954 [Gossypium arboreum]
MRYSVYRTVTALDLFRRVLCLKQSWQEILIRGSSLNYIGFILQLRAMVEEGSNYCVITPPKKLNVTVIDTYDEHQMAMTFSLAAQRFQLPSKILVVLGKPSPNTSKFSRGLRSIK